MDFEAARAGLIQHLRMEIRDEYVLAAMSNVPRELFVPADEKHLAYEDRPLPIGCEQTISQPLIIAMMTSALLKNGIEHLSKVRLDLLNWMEEKEYESIRQMQGSMSQLSVTDPAAFERANYMKVLRSFAF